MDLKTFFSLLLCLTVLDSSRAGVDEERREKMKVWHWPEDTPSLLSSAYTLNTRSPYNVVLEHLEWHDFNVRILRDKTPVFNFAARSFNVFIIDGDVLLRAVFSHAASGCRIVAFDLVAKKTLWETDLKGIGRQTHSLYSNRVNMQLIELAGKELLRVDGWEEFGKYIEFLDLRTGETVEHYLVN